MSERSLLSSMIGFEGELDDEDSVNNEKRNDGASGGGGERTEAVGGRCCQGAVLVSIHWAVRREEEDELSR